MNLCVYVGWPVVRVTTVYRYADVVRVCSRVTLYVMRLPDERVAYAVDRCVVRTVARAVQGEGPVWCWSRRTELTLLLLLLLLQCALRLRFPIFAVRVALFLIFSYL